MGLWMGRLEKKGKTGDYYWRMDSRMRGILLEIISLMELCGLPYRGERPLERWDLPLKIHTHQKSFFFKDIHTPVFFFFQGDTGARIFFLEKMHQIFFSEKIHAPKCLFERFMALRSSQHAPKYLEEVAALIHQTPNFEVEKEAILTRESCTHGQLSFR